MKQEWEELEMKQEYKEMEQEWKTMKQELTDQKIEKIRIKSPLFEVSKNMLFEVLNLNFRLFLS